MSAQFILRMSVASRPECELETMEVGVECELELDFHNGEIFGVDAHLIEIWPGWPAAGSSSARVQAQGSDG